jgi:hypothetical protein
VYVNEADLVYGLNEWMRRFTEEPGKFEREWETVSRFLSELASGVQPSYGQVGAKYLQRILEDRD